MEERNESAILLQNSEEPSSNERVVTLIQEKLIPLNRGKYEHLKKINQAIRKN